MAKVDFLILLTDVTKYSFPTFHDMVDNNLPKNDAVKNYFIDWTNTIMEKLSYEEHPTQIEFHKRYWELIRKYCDARLNELIDHCPIKKEKPTKVAQLVTFEITTRVIVDVCEDEEKLSENAVNAAIENIKKNGIDNYLVWDNVSEIQDDVECPYGSISTDK